MVSYILTVVLSASVAQAPKKVEFAKIQKIAVDAIKDKDYPKNYRPFELEGKILKYDLSCDPFSTREGASNPNEMVLATLMLSEKVRQFGIPEMSRDHTENIARKIDGGAREAINKLNEGKLNKEDAMALADKLYGEAAGTVQAEAEKHAKKNKLAFAGKTGVVPVLVATRPKGRVIHAMPDFQRKLIIEEGRDLDKELEQNRYADSLPFMGRVYYMISWEEGRNKTKPGSTVVAPPQGGGPYVFP